jgi:hypothetical protein
MVSSNNAAMFADARGDDLVDVSDVSSCPTQLSITRSCAFRHRAIVDYGRSLHPTSLGIRLWQDHLQDRAQQHGP